MSNKQIAAITLLGMGTVFALQYLIGSPNPGELASQFAIGLATGLFTARTNPS